MGRKNKVFGLKGQKEMIDSLNGLFANFVNRETQAVIDKGLELGRYAGNGFGSPEEVDDPLGRTASGWSAVSHRLCHQVRAWKSFWGNSRTGIWRTGGQRWFVTDTTRSGKCRPALVL